MSVNIYYESDTNPKLLADKRICVLGYGSQGNAHSRNLADSGLNVVVGLREGSKTFDKVKADGLEPMEINAAVKGADIICFLLPDTSQPEVYQKYVVPNIKPGAAMLFAHGFNLHYGQIIPPADNDVIMVAPKGPGKLVRDLYEQGQGVPCLCAVAQDASGQAKDLALAYAWGIGGARAGVIETTFEEETETDLFGEQAVLCGGLSSLMKAGFETLVEAGYAPEMAYFECIHETKLIIDLIYQGGLKKMRRFISETAKYGDITRGPRVVPAEAKQEMRRVLDEIQDGRFAREWILENQVNRPVYHALLRKDEEHQMEKVGAQLRGMMKWLGE